MLYVRWCVPVVPNYDEAVPRNASMWGTRKPGDKLQCPLAKMPKPNCAARETAVEEGTDPGMMRSKPCITDKSVRLLGIVHFSPTKPSPSGSWGQQSLDSIGFDSFPTPRSLFYDFQPSV